MSSNDNNLLTFLKKQSLFSNSPSKNVSRKRSSRSRSKDRSNDIRPATNQLQENPFPARNLFNPQENASNNYQREYSPIQNAKTNLPSNETRFGSFEELEPRRDLRAPEPRPLDPPRQPESVRGGEPRGKEGEDRNNMWTGLVSYSTSF